MTKSAKPTLNFHQIGSLIRLGQRMLAKSFDVLQTEKLRNSFSPSNRIRTAWPMIVTEFSDLVEGSTISPRTYYTGEEIKLADEICQIFSDLPQTRIEKKITLVRARTGKSWRELATRFHKPWQECRKISDNTTICLVQAAALDIYLVKAKQAQAHMASNGEASFRAPRRYIHR